MFECSDRLTDRRNIRRIVPLTATITLQPVPGQAVLSNCSLPPGANASVVA